MIPTYWKYAVPSLLFVALYYAAGVTFYSFVMHLDVTQSVWFLTCTITTIGFEYPLDEDDNVSKAITMCFLVLGVVVVASILAQLAFHAYCVHRDSAFKAAMTAGGGGGGGGGTASSTSARSLGDAPLGGGGGGGGVRRGVAGGGRRVFEGYGATSPFDGVAAASSPSPSSSSSKYGEDSKGRRKNAAIVLLDHQIAYKKRHGLWLCVEIVLLTFVGMGLMGTVEAWDTMDLAFFSVQTLTSVGYFESIPYTTVGMWIAVVYMLAGVFIVANIIISLSSLPRLFEQRDRDRLVMAQFDGRLDDTATRAIADPTGRMAARLQPFSIFLAPPEAAAAADESDEEEGEEEAKEAPPPRPPPPATAPAPVSSALSFLSSFFWVGGGRGGGGGGTNGSGGGESDGGESDGGESPLPHSAAACCSSQAFGSALAEESDEHLEMLRQLTEGRDTVSRDEFTLWLLLLLGRTNQADLEALRELYGTFAAAVNVDGGGDDGGGGGDMPRKGRSNREPTKKKEKKGEEEEEEAPPLPVLRFVDIAAERFY